MRYAKKGLHKETNRLKPKSVIGGQSWSLYREALVEAFNREEIFLHQMGTTLKESLNIHK